MDKWTDGQREGWMNGRTDRGREQNIGKVITTSASIIIPSQPATPWLAAQRWCSAETETLKEKRQHQ